MKKAKKNKNKKYKRKKKERKQTRIVQSTKRIKTANDSNTSMSWIITINSCGNNDNVLKRISNWGNKVPPCYFIRAKN